MGDAQRRSSNRRYDARRAAESPTRKLYGTQRWRRRAAHQLLIEPLCRMCQAKGVVRAASVADHIIPHRGDVDAFWSGELQSVCADDHNITKQREEARGYSDSVDADGWPADPRHPANAHAAPAQATPMPALATPGGSKSLEPLAPRPAAPHRAKSREIGDRGRK